MARSFIIIQLTDYSLVCGQGYGPSIKSGVTPKNTLGQMKSPDQEFGTPVPTWGRPGESGLDGATVSRRTYGQVQMSCYRQTPNTGITTLWHRQQRADERFWLSSLQQLAFLLANVAKQPGGPVQPPIVGW